jgi:hypothetical protein
MPRTPKVTHRGRYKVRLTKKFADFLDGVDLSRVRAGELIDVPDRAAYILLAEGWARPASSADKPSRRRLRTTTKKRTR